MAEMAVEALPELAEAAESAGGAAGGAAEGGGEPSGSDLFGDTPQPGANEQGKQQNVGESRNLAFQSSAMSVRSAVRPAQGGGSGGGMSRGGVD